VKPDVDNFGTFLLDSLTGALFVDDAQVVAIHMYKLRDYEGMCNGRIQIECFLVNKEAWQIIVPNW
jgi:Holliday junction resolvase RusA-like endonuclease